MKTKIKLSLLSLLVLASLTQCGDNIQYYDMTGEKSDGVYFPQATTNISLVEDENYFTIPINRTESSGELNLKVNVSEDKNNTPGVFSVNENVSFQAGEKTAYIRIGYDISKLAYESTQKLTLNIEPSVAWNYGTIQTQLNLVRTAEWIELGTGFFTDYYWSYYGYFKKGFTSLNDYYYEYVTVERRQDNPNYYRINNPYQGYLTSPYFQFQILQKGDTFLGQEITKENLVTWSEAPYVFNCYGETWLWFPGYLTDAYEEEDYWIYNIVESYFDNGWPEVVRISPLFWQGDPENETTIGWDFSGWDEEYSDYYCSIYFPTPE